MMCLLATSQTGQGLQVAGVRARAAEMRQSKSFEPGPPSRRQSWQLIDIQGLASLGSMTTGAVWGCDSEVGWGRRREWRGGMAEHGLRCVSGQ